MARTSQAKVESVLGRDYDRVNRPDLTPYLETANAVVTRVIALGAADGLPTTSTIAELMERWLAAHYYTKSDATYTSRSNMGASGSFNKGPDDYKNVAIDLDPTGQLAALLGRVTAVGFWLGKPPSDQIDYVDRD